MTLDNAPVRVVIADREPLRRAGIRSSLLPDPRTTVVGEVDDLASAVREADRLWADVIAVTTAGLLERPPVRAGGHRCPLVLLTDPAEIDAMLTGVRLGVRGFVDKHGADPDLARAVVAMAGGEVFMSPTLAARLLDWTASRLPGRPTKLTRLSLREREVLCLLGQGDSNFDIARRLSIREATVRSHVYHILTKLDLKSRTEAALLGYQHGLSTDAAEPALRRTVAPALP